MKLQSATGELSAAVSHVARMAGRLGTLAGVIIDARESGTVSLTATNLDDSAVAHMSAAVTEPGRILVSARLLNDVTKHLPSAAARLEADQSRATLTCGRARFQLPLLPAHEWPAPAQQPGYAGILDGHRFAAVVTSVAAAAKHDDTLPMFTCVRIAVDGDRLELAATDRYRLAMRSIACSPSGYQPPEDGTHILVPAKSLTEATKRLTSDTTYGANTQHFGLASEGRQTLLRVFQGTFPDVKRLMPTDFAGQATVDVTTLTDAISRTQVVLGPLSPVHLTIGAGEIGLKAGHGDEAAAAETIQADTEGDTITVAYNPKYLADAAKHCPTCTVVIGWNDAQKPAVLWPAEGDDDYTHLIMPVKS